MPGHRLADVHIPGDLVEQAGRQGFTEDGDEAGHGQGQQAAQRQALGGSYRSGRNVGGRGV
ncbi:hypothetical protein D3C80_1789280 [compost metagenome]